MNTSPRLGISYPQVTPSRTDAPDIPQHIKNMIDWLDLSVLVYSGLEANLPVSTGGSPGKIGRVYYATDSGKVFFDYGTGWDQIYPQAGTPDGSVTGGPAGVGVKIAAHTITNDNIVAGTIRSTEILDGTIVAADLASALKPSAGAGAATEALRALGTAAGTAAAGLHAAQHAAAGADPISVSQAMLAAGAAAGQAYGTAFPTVGLYNGYRFTIFMTDDAGSVAYDCIYRVDLDATYPWHVVSGAPMKSSSDGGVSQSSAVFTARAPAITPTRAGVYEMEYGGLVSCTGNPASRLGYLCPQSTTSIVATVSFAANAGQSSSSDNTSTSVFTATQITAYYSRVFTLTAASEVVQLYTRANGTDSTSFSRMFLRITPKKLA